MDARIATSACVPDSRPWDCSRPHQGAVVLLAVRRKMEWLARWTAPAYSSQAVMAALSSAGADPAPSSRSRSVTSSDTASRNRTVLSPTCKSSK
jgi:hypothetical protein